HHMAPQQMTTCNTEASKLPWRSEPHADASRNYIGNVVKNPAAQSDIDDLFCALQERVGSLGGIYFLELCGFEKPEGDEILFLARDKVDKAVLNVAGAERN
uniref:Uncharacterized protein n=1 Tax=Aegilops tauschii subsp. strangulata TaxID=200361 RepID=A0A453HXM0_AEGTS